MPVAEAFGVVIGRVVDEATRATGIAPVEVVVTHPAAWGEERRATVRVAALAAAGTAQVRLVAEPVAAARHLVTVAGDRLPDGGTALVYDLGAGTFDATVVRRAGDAFEVLATQGRPDSGGLDIDAAIVAHLTGAVPDEAGWRRLTSPGTVADRRARQQLWDNVRSAKEALTRASNTMVYIPLLDADVPLGREELDRLARPILEQTVRTARAVLAEAGVEPGTVFLVGAASRMPAVSSTLHRELGVEPITVDQPELAVAEGSLLGAAPPAAAAEIAPPPLVVARPPSPARRRGLTLGAAAVALVLLAGVAAYAGLGGGNGDPGGSPSGLAAGAGSSARPSASASPAKSYPPGVDPCLLGTWRMTNATNFWSINNVERQTQGQAGQLFTFREDGTLVIDDSHTEPEVAIADGVRWEARPSGTTTMRWSANLETKELQEAVISTDAKRKVYRNGKFFTESNTEFLPEPGKYVCTATTLTENSTLGKWSSSATRVS
ncbi:hypothetical protein GCM10022255_010000 [Dactylosporangium darangshiense]|uniref:Hsp70 protein n=1 Tax=Dactylosporangium darangshiense TaxID=579108 RepID=A0ABP8CYC6_9ACTN